MDAVVVGALSSVVVCVMILLGMHVGVSLALTSVIGVYFISGKLNVGLRMLESTAYNALNDYIFAVIPLFILMGAFATASGVMRDLFNSMEALLQRVRGGLGIATVAGNAVFSAITGVTVASAVVFSQISIPEMRRLGYNKKFALGIVASSALLGMLIPPSLLMVVYGVLTEESIGKLFAAGMGPGVVVSLALSLAIVVMIRFNPALSGVEGVRGGGGTAHQPPRHHREALGRLPARAARPRRHLCRLVHAHRGRRDRRARRADPHGAEGQVRLPHHLRAADPDRRVDRVDLLPADHRADVFPHAEPLRPAGLHHAPDGRRRRAADRHHPVLRGA